MTNKRPQKFLEAQEILNSNPDVMILLETAHTNNDKLSSYHDNYDIISHKNHPKEKT